MKLLRSILMAVVVLTAVVACHDGSTSSASHDGVKLITLVAEGDTRTSLDAERGVVCWSAGDRVAVIENGSKLSVSEDAVIDNSGRASFTARFESNLLEKFFTYDAIYPAESVDATPLNGDVIEYALPAVQHPSSNSFDPAADILISQRERHLLQPSMLAMRFKRMVAIGELRLVGLEGVAVERVSITVEGATLAGVNSVDLSSGEVVGYGVKDASQCITVEYAEPQSIDVPIYFVCNPLQLAAGDSFVVDVVCQEGSYQRSVTLAEGRELRFERGAITHFAVRMTEEDTPIKPEPPVGSFAAGNYLIVANGEMMAAYKSGGFFQSVSYDVENRSDAVWNFDYDAESEAYTIHTSAGKYVAMNTSHKPLMKESEDEAVRLVVEMVDGGYTLKVKGDESYYLQYKPSTGSASARFSFYTLSDELIPTLQLIPVE